MSLLNVYYAMPAWARTLAASAYGYYLYSWRYGQETESLVRAALERDQWDLQQIEARQKEQLAALLHHAATKVPYYREMWQRLRREGNRCSWEDLANWPFLEKEAVRTSPEAFLADDYDRRKLLKTNTSGTTGKPLQLWQSRTALRQWYALSEARWRRWYGVTKDDRWAILGGQLVTPVHKDTPPFWIWNQGLKQLYMSSYHLSPRLIPSYLHALKEYRVSYVLGYTSALHTLAQHAIADGRTDLTFRVIITNAEPVTPEQRATISAAFRCPVRETYGMSEMVAAASECEHGRLHLWPAAGVVETFNGAEPVPPGESGELVCTGLLTPEMPLIRYRVGDRGTLAPRNYYCPCGRRLPMLLSIEGRLDDVLYTASGRRIGRLDPVLKGDLPIREFQIVQRRLDEVHVNVVPADGWSRGVEATISERLRQRMGEIRIVFHTMESIPRGANGKFRAVVCLIRPEEIPAAGTVGSGEAM